MALSRFVRRERHRPQTASGSPVGETTLVVLFSPTVIG